ncbi:MAG: DUF4390 domain-containing protein [Candidatus Delongbacteria bacterium]|nr:DUF4390 domain-containing protein [bacterium]MBL7033709.1 DUF4390 domain-containing protein [Candidatus Delongbacteria bacterium]
MFEALSQTLAAWVIAAGSVFVSPESSTEVDFSQPTLTLEENRIVLSVELVDWHTEEMDRILESGQTLTIHFDLDVYQEREQAPYNSYSFDHAITMDLIDQTYHINCSEQELEYQTTTLNEMRNHAGSLRSFNLLDLNELQGDTSFVFELRAHLENIDLPGLMNDFDMMRYWRGKIPRLESPSFKRSDFLL